METLRDVNRWEKGELARLEKERKAVIEYAERKRLLLSDYGGFISRAEIVDLLEVSNARVGVLIARAEFRECEYGYSLTDVRSYKKRRKSGRPKKGRKFHADQLKLKL